jgi:hypothetical protein
MKVIELLSQLSSIASMIIAAIALAVIIFRKPRG